MSSEQLSDFEPKGAACAAFGVLHPGGFPQRALVITGADASRSLELSKRPRPASCRASICCAKAWQPRFAKLLRFGKREKRNGPPTDGRNMKGSEYEQ